MKNRSLTAGALVGLAWLTSAGAARAETYRVGPAEQNKDFSSLPTTLKPGDVVEVQGNATYSGDVRFRGEGTAEARIVIRGMAVDGKKPVIQGGDYGVLLTANHIDLDGFEVTGSNSACVLHKGDHVRVLNTVVHDCPSHGLLGTDTESGSLTIAHSEFYKNGEGDRRHQIYVATDEEMYPGSVFRLEHTFVHDGAGGNNVKSRAERNEIYGNWIEGATYHELDLIGPDGADPSLKREDSDVVGNVLIQRSGWQIGRLGGDGTGETGGRYRFVNNTIVLDSADGDLVFRMTDSIDSVEIHNNVIFRTGGRALRLFRDTEAKWVGGQTIAGGTNWMPTGTDLPATVTGTVFGSDPGFESLDQFDLRPVETSPLVNQGTVSPPSPSGHEFPSPLMVPVEQPPGRAPSGGETLPRPEVEALDIGAYEFGSGPPRQPIPATPGSNDPGTGAGGGGSEESGCACRTAGRPMSSSTAPWLSVIGLAIAFAWRRRR